MQYEKKIQFDSKQCYYALEGFIDGIQIYHPKFRLFLQEKKYNNNSFLIPRPDKSDFSDCYVIQQQIILKHLEQYKKVQETNEIFQNLIFDSMSMFFDIPREFLSMSDDFWKRYDQYIQRKKHSYQEE